MITDADVQRIPGATVYGSDGEKIGKAGAVYRDDQSGRPDWMTVQTGLFGTSESFVPLADADFDGDDVRVPFDKSRVKDAPRVDSEGHLDISEEDRLFEHYGMAGAGQHASGGQDESRGDLRDDRRDDRHDEPRAGTRELALDRGDDRRDDSRDDRRDEGLLARATDRDDAGHRDDAAATSRRDDDSGLWSSSRDTHRAEHRADDRTENRFGAGDEGDRSSAAPAAAVGLGGLAAAAAASQADDRADDRSDTRARDLGRDEQRDEQRGDHRLNPVDLRDGSGDRQRDQQRGDQGRTTDRSGLSSSPVAGAGAQRSDAQGERKSRLSQWVLVERTAIIEVSDEEAQRLAGGSAGGSATDLRSTETRADR